MINKITLPIGPVINFIVEKIIWVFNMLQDIEFLGTNLLAFSLTILLLGVLLPILFTIAKGTTYNVAKIEMRKKK